MATGADHKPEAGRAYSAGAILLHWLTALCLVGLIAIGLTMTRLPPSDLALKFSLYQLHKSIGITVLLLTLLRLAWRLRHPPPPLPDTLAPWQRHAAKGVHLTFYGLLLVLPLVGWALVSASTLDIPTVLYGVLPWPHLPLLSSLSDKAAAEAGFKVAHRLLAYGTLLLILLHVAAALKHQLVDKDEVLARMVPPLRRMRR